LYGKVNRKNLMRSEKIWGTGNIGGTGVATDPKPRDSNPRVPEVTGSQGLLSLGFGSVT
jgi:hypothetical protein